MEVVAETSTSGNQSEVIGLSLPVTSVDETTLERTTDPLVLVDDTLTNSMMEDEARAAFCSPTFAHAHRSQ